MWFKGFLGLQEVIGKKISILKSQHVHQSDIRLISFTPKSAYILAKPTSQENSLYC